VGRPISRSSAYYAPIGIDPATLVVMKAIDKTFTRYPFFGSRQMHTTELRDNRIKWLHGCCVIPGRIGRADQYVCTGMGTR
jgi:hypothetical protein